MSDSELVTTPAEGVIIRPEETTNTDTQVETTVTTTETATTTSADTRDFATELTTKDNEIAQLRAQLNAVGDDKAAKERLSLELGTAINDRASVAKERDEALASRSQAIDTLTTATESLIDHSGELARKIQEYEAQIAAEKNESASRLAKLTKYEVLTKEFQHLLPYADRILNSEDPEKVRADAKEFAKTRESDLDTYKRLVAGSALSIPGTQPTTPETESLPEDSEARMAYLRASMKDPKEFEKALANMRAGYEQSRALAS